MSTPSTVQSDASSSATNLSTDPEFNYIPQGKAVDRALAIQLDEECMNRWGQALFDECYPGDRVQQTPEEVMDAIKHLRLLTTQYMSYEVYCKFPNIPHLERNVLFVPCPKLTWMFVFKDNSSYEAIRAPLAIEDVRAVKEFLGVKKQNAKWYDVSHRVLGTCTVVSCNL